MRIFVAIATVGRADLVRRTLDLLAEQTRPADGVVVSTVAPKDIVGIEQAHCQPEVIFAPRGLCCQRNAALRAIGDRADAVVFFDDDFLPSPDFLQELDRLFTDHADVVGITGSVLADGAHGAGFTFEQGMDLVQQRAALPALLLSDRKTLYGCNMAFRMSATHGLQFDENLPLYGWLEDIDFTFQLGQRGRMVCASTLTGVHLGTKGGRMPGRRNGYSQVANVIYLKRKGTIEPGLGERLLRQNLLSNLVKSVRPEPQIDRRGRLVGNLMAIKDWLTGRLDPRRIERL